MRPPWFSERLLDSFIENPEVAEDMLGDLTEEWHQRAKSEGPRAASWWYRKQVARSLVHLIRSGYGRALTPALLGAGLTAALPLLLFTGWAALMTSVAGLATGMFGNASGDGGETLPLTRTAAAVWAARALIASFGCAVVGGFLPGLLSRVAGMVQVSLLAAAWIPCALALQLLAAEDWPEWYGATLPVVLVLGTFAGGIGGVAMRRSGRRPPARGATRLP
ncbi:MAG TPA: permease prefix domain 2-containing transporter [Gammaproteobacteria bacterium]|nr:permease prefix domain 2-containing transporter [Gammaproteobacteria bacterium]